MVNSSPKTPMEPIKRYPTNPYAKSPPPNSQPRTPTKSIYTASPGPYAPGFNPPTVQPHTPPTNPYRRASSSSKRSSKNHSPGKNVCSSAVARKEMTLPAVEREEDMIFLDGGGGIIMQSIGQIPNSVRSWLKKRDMMMKLTLNNH